MATLRSEDDQQPSTLEISKGAIELIGGQNWQRFQLTARSGTFVLKLAGNQDSTESSSGSPVDCLFCRDPKDEVSELAAKIEQMVNFTKDRVLFEPAEPSFELSICRAGASGVKVEVWLDSGSATDGIYRWDAAGIRFHTLQEHLADFLKELKQEFAC
jgi:hypothetical protein